MAGSERIWLETFNSPEEAAGAYNDACWRFDRGQEWLNFPDVKSWEEADFLALPPNLQTREYHARPECAHLKLEVTRSTNTDGGVEARPPQRCGVGGGLFAMIALHCATGYDVIVFNLEHDVLARPWRPMCNTTVAP
jgi:hypothetical protein